MGLPRDDRLRERRGGVVALDANTGMRARDLSGNTLFDHFDYARYWEVIMEQVKSWSYMKFPFLRSLGADQGWYRVGPLSRVTQCDSIPTPLAEEARKDFLDIPEV